MTAPILTPGTLVSARGREWVVLPGSEEGRLRLRPLTGTDADTTVLLPDLERAPPRPATFPPPDPTRPATASNALLLADALRLSLRRGAGPFRSAGQIAFEPRTYQLVPLIMSLGLDPVRLLIADDVGIGKTVEAGLILREHWDRGEIDRAAVICPPHLVEQWVEELAEKFDLHATAITATTARRLERGLRREESLFDAHPITVVSLDYIKADRRRTEFARHCPSFAIVDEAHTCVGGGRGVSQRYQLLRKLADDDARHLVLLTATPHSGNQEAFDNLLGLLKPEFAERALTDAREGLARHFVQRRRIDVRDEGWEHGAEARRTFPKHETGERTFVLTPAHLAFHEAVIDWCTERAAGADSANSRRLAIWGTLALMRCVGSSPAAALATLEARQDGIAEEDFEPSIFDEENGQLSDDDLEPPVQADVDGLDRLVAMARDLHSEPTADAKLALLAEEITGLVAEGFRPVIFCRYIATAEYVSRHLTSVKSLKGHKIETVTGRLPGTERRARVEALGDHDKRILVATDCLSEGINLQTLFDAVVHYDLSWNPTRHQQREGRVDRFGQPSPEVRSLTLFGSNSAIDGAVLDVILRKADAIREATNVSVSMLEDRGTVSEALMAALLLKSEAGAGTRQMDLFRDHDPVADVERLWRDAEENEKASRARFAQRRLRPAEVNPQWQRTKELLGGDESLEPFLSRALNRFDLDFDRKTVPVDSLPDTVREPLAARGISGRVPVTFDDVARPGEIALHRTHPVVSALAQTLVEGALDDGDTALPRAGAWTVRSGAPMRTLAILRIRHRIRRKSAAAADFLLAEEILPVLWQGAESAPIIVGPTALDVLQEERGTNLGDRVRLSQIERARARVLDGGSLPGVLAQRASELAEDHDRLSSAARREARTLVEPVENPDIVGLYVILPEQT